MNTPCAIRGAFLDFVDDPFLRAESDCARFVADGLLVIEGGTIRDRGRYDDLKVRYAGLEIQHYPGKLLLPGFIDCHAHYPQTRVIGSGGHQLLEWLATFVFPEEIKFRDAEYAREVAGVFLDELLRCGTTTVLSYTTTYPASCDVFFEEASKRNMRVIAGVTGFDRPGMAPEGYRDTAKGFYASSKALYSKWHGRGRNLYAVTPRFALGCTEEQLKFAGQLYRELPGAYMNTHLAETTGEVAAVKAAFPSATDYLNVYESHGLIGPRCVFGHGIYLSESEFERIAKSGSSIAFCPSSNLFLGSGLFQLPKAKSKGAKVGLGTDVGGGNFFSHLRVLNDAYKVAILQGQPLTAFQGLYLATRGGAKALDLDDKLGSFDIGKEADFVVLDLMATPELAERNRSAELKTLDDVAFKAFGLIALGDSRAVTATYVAGVKVGA